MQKGGTVGLLLVVFGILVITIGGGYWLWREDTAPPPVLGPVVQPEGTQNVRKTRTFVVYDSNFAYNGTTLYYRSGKDRTTGEPLYSVAPVRAPEKFEKVGSATVPASSSNSLSGSSTYSQSSYSAGTSQSQQSQQTLGGTTGLGSALGTGSPQYSVSYYTDGENVYMVIETESGASAPQVVVGADPETFQILNAEYAKDESHVYVVIVSCAGDTCTATISIVASADPDTFQAFPNTQQVLNTDCTGYVSADAQDQYSVFNNGQVVDGISVYAIGESGSCDDTPVLISP
jgi:hypothetical protein